MTSLKTSIKTITYLSDIGCLEIQGPVYLLPPTPPAPFPLISNSLLSLYRLMFPVLFRLPTTALQQT